MAENTAEVEHKAKRPFRKFTYRGVDLDQLLDIQGEQLIELLHSRARRRFSRGGLKRKESALVKKLRRAKKDAPPMEKPEAVKTHLRNMIIVPEMVGSIIGVYNGKVFNQIEIKPEMIGHYLGEFSVTYKPVKHGRPGIGATHSSRSESKLLERAVNTHMLKRDIVQLNEHGDILSRKNIRCLTKLGHSNDGYLRHQIVPINI